MHTNYNNKAGVEIPRTPISLLFEISQGDQLLFSKTDKIPRFVNKAGFQATTGGREGGNMHMHCTWGFTTKANIPSDHSAMRQKGSYILHCALSILPEGLVIHITQGSQFTRKKPRTMYHLT